METANYIVSQCRFYCPECEKPHKSPSGKTYWTSTELHNLIESNVYIHVCLNCEARFYMPHAVFAGMACGPEQ